LERSLDGKPKEITDEQRAAIQKRDQEREAARQRLQEEARKNPGQRLLPEFGSDKDFQLQQALRQLKGQPVVASKSLTVRSEEKKDN
jgi:carboxyl-terminal processing protease